MSDAERADGPTGSYGSVQEQIEGNYSQRTVGGVNVASASDAVDDRPLEELTVAELRAEAQNIGLEGVSKLKHDELVSAIQERYVEIDAEGDGGSQEPSTDPDADPGE